MVEAPAPETAAEGNVVVTDNDVSTAALSTSLESGLFAKNARTMPGSATWA